MKFPEGRLEAEASLRESEARFRSVLDNSRDVIYRVNVQTGIYEYISPSAERVLGFSAAELMAQDVRTNLALVHPDDLPAVQAAHARLEETGEVDLEYRQQTKSGDYRWLSNHLSLSRDSTGRPLYRSGNLSDITERKLAEESLRKTEAEFRAIFELSAVGKAHVDPLTGRFLRVNNRFCEINGYSREELLQKTFTDITYHEDRARDFEAFEKARHPETPTWKSEKRYIRKDGSVVWVSISGTVLFDRDGRPYQSAADIVDITTRKRAEEALLRKQAELVEAQRIARIGSWNWDAGTDATTGSDELLRIYGFDPATQKMPDFKEQKGQCYPAEDWERINAAVQETLRTGVGYELDVQAFRNGASIWVTTRSEAVRDAEGRIAGLRGTVQDVTERKRAEEEINRRNTILSGINSIFKEAIRDATGREVAAVCLRIAEEITESKVGFICEFGLDEFPDNIIGNPDGERCTVYETSEKRKDYADIHARGLFARVIKDGKGFFTNDPSTHPDSIGFPSGYPPVTAFLGAALKREGKTFGMIVVANRKGGYRQEELEALEALTPSMAEVMHRARVEASENLLNRSQQMAHLGSWELDAVNNRLAWTDEVYRIYGLQPKEFGATYEAFLEGVHPDDRAAVDSAYSSSLREGRDTYEIEHRVVRKSDGEVRIILEKCEHHRDASGKIIRSTGMVHDVTERKRAEVALRESEQKFSLMFHKAGFATALSRLPDGAFVDVNEAWIKLFGYTREEAIGKTSFEIDINPDAEGRALIISQLQKYGSVRDQELTLRTKSGDLLVLVANVGLVDIAGQKYVLNMVQDITARKKMEADLLKLSEDMAARNLELESLNKELEAYTYSVSHDLRAPMRSVSGFAKAVVEDYSDKLDAQGRDYLKRILNGSEKMTGLINDLLRLSRISRQEIARGRIDLSAAVSVLVTELRQANPERNVQVEIKVGVKALADHTLMKIVLENLIGNAWKFTSKKQEAKIEFGSTEINGKTVYYVKDNGAGFDSAYSDKMFQPFHRLHSGKEFEGTGIGLAIVERIIQRHGGKVWAEGEVDKGATVCFTL